MDSFKRLLGRNTPRRIDPKVHLENVRELVRFYGRFGFFEKKRSAEGIDDLAQEYFRSFGWHLDLSKPWDEVYLLSLDTHRVWNGDPEADVCSANNVYCRVLPEWGAISLGCFAPEEIVEAWETESGPIRVDFKLGDQRHSIRPQYQNDYIDLTVLRQMNEIIAPTGRQFEYVYDDGNFAIVLVLTQTEKDEVVQARRVPFASMR